MNKIKSLDEWDAKFQEACDKFDAVGEFKTIEKVEGEIIELYEIEQSRQKISPIDKDYTEIKSLFDFLADTAKSWIETGKPKYRLIALSPTKHLEFCEQKGIEFVPLPADKDRSAFVNFHVSPYIERKISATTMSDAVAAQKRLLRRYDERLTQTGHDIRATMKQG